MSETPQAKKRRIDKKVVAAPEKYEQSGASDESQASDEFEESAQKGWAMTMLLEVNARASEAFEAPEKSVKKGCVIRNPLTVNPYLKYAMSHTDFCMMLGDAINAIFAGESHALQWVSHPSYHGEAFSMFCHDSGWYLQLGPKPRARTQLEAVEAGARCQRSRGFPRLAAGSRGRRGEAKGSQAGGKGC